MHWRCLGEKVCTGVRAPKPAWLANPMPIFNPGTVKSIVKRQLSIGRCFVTSGHLFSLVLTTRMHVLRGATISTVSSGSQKLPQKISKVSEHQNTSKWHGQIICRKFFPALAHFVFGAMCQFELLLRVLAAMTAVGIPSYELELPPSSTKNRSKVPFMATLAPDFRVQNYHPHVGFKNKCFNILIFLSAIINR